jgi:hypothetical protein
VSRLPNGRAGAPSNALTSIVRRGFDAMLGRRSERAYPGDIVLKGSRNSRAIVTTITDNFVGLGSAFLLSLAEQVKSLKQVDVILVQAPEVAPLSEQNRRALAALCPGLHIVDVDVSGFLNDANMVRYDDQGRARSEAALPSKKAAYVKLNVLRFTAYEHVLLMDSDLLVLQDFSELFNLPFALAAVPSGTLHRRIGVNYIPAGRGLGTFNSGVLLLGRSNRGEEAFNAAIDQLDSGEPRKLRDQSVLNEIFRYSEKLLLPPTYNFKIPPGPRALHDRPAMMSSKVLHFIGPSKFQLTDPSHAGAPIYDLFHSVQARTGLPFTLTR